MTKLSAMATDCLERTSGNLAQAAELLRQRMVEDDDLRALCPAEGTHALFSRVMDQYKARPAHCRG